MKNFLKNFKYAFSSNLLGIIVSPITVFIIPKLLGVEEYGFFQFFTFLAEYFCLLHFGVVDGIYLKYGGHNYETLDKPYFKKLISSFFVMQLIVGVTASAVGFIIADSKEKQFIYIALGFSTLLANSKTILQFIFQATGKIKEYAFVNISDRLFFLAAILIALVFKVNSFIPLIIINLATKLAGLLMAVYYGKDLLLVSTKYKLKEIMHDIFAYSKSGLNLTFSYIASISIIGIVRLSIENQWDIATFGKISLTLSVSNLLMIFIRAVSTVMFPALRRVSKDKLSWIYQTMRTSIMLPLLGMLVLYYPGKIILSIWLPQYTDSLKYMALLFPMCVFESKMSMLVETYMKTLRLEKKLLLVNAVTLALSFVCAGVTAFWLHNLDLAVLSIVVLLAFRCVFAELLLSRSLEIKVKKDIFLEIVLTIIFIVSSWTIGGVIGVAGYFIVYLCYLFIQRKQITELVITFKSIVGSMKSENSLNTKSET